MPQEENDIHLIWGWTVPLTFLIKLFVLYEGNKFVKIGNIKTSVNF